MLQTEVIHNPGSLERYNFKRKLQQGTPSRILQDEGKGLQGKEVCNIEATISEGLLACSLLEKELVLHVQVNISDVACASRQGIC